MSKDKQWFTTNGYCGGYKELPETSGVYLIVKVCDGKIFINKDYFSETKNFLKLEKLYIQIYNPEFNIQWRNKNVVT